MIDLGKYGYLLEEYAYSFDDNEQVKEISYTKHNEQGDDIQVVGVYKDPKTGEPLRSVLKWPQRNNGEADGIMNELLQGMKLDLHTIGKEYNSANLHIYTYENSEFQDDDNFDVKLTPDVTINVHESEACVYDDKIGLVKFYPVLEGGSIDYHNLINYMIVTDFGIIDINDKTKFEAPDGGFVYVTYTGDGATRVLSCDVEHTEDIEPLKWRATSVSTDDNFGTEFNYTIGYYDDGMVCSVNSDTDLLYSRSERVWLDDKVVDDRAFEKADSIYPLLVSENVDDYRYPFMMLWCKDTLTYNYGKKVSFERYVYYIDPNNCKDLVDTLRADIDRLMINNDEEEDM